MHIHILYCAYAAYESQHGQCPHCGESCHPAGLGPNLPRWESAREQLSHVLHPPCPSAAHTGLHQRPQWVSLTRSLARSSPLASYAECNPSGSSGMFREETPSSFLQLLMMRGCFHIPLILFSHVNGVILYMDGLSSLKLYYLFLFRCICQSSLMRLLEDFMMNLEATDNSACLDPLHLLLLFAHQLK